VSMVNTPDRFSLRVESILVNLSRCVFPSCLPNVTFSSHYVDPPVTAERPAKKPGLLTTNTVTMQGHHR
jgi:hypothetical protein